MVSPTSINALKRSALIVEQNTSLSRMFAAHLKHEGYVVRTACKGEDALRLYRDCAPFDVVLVDYGMPRKTGIDVAVGILKHDPKQPMIITALEYRSENEVPRPKELMDVPLLLEMGNHRLRSLLQAIQPWATREEVDRAITALTPAELLKLKRFADGRVCFSRGSDNRTGEDLLQEALRSTCEGAEGGGNGRRWNTRVSFVTHLIGAIRSISGRRKGDGVLLECDTFKCDADGQEFSLLENLPANDTPADQRLIMDEKMNLLLGMFHDDPEAVLVLRCWSEGIKKREIMQEGLSENQYRATVKRIRIKLLGSPNGGGGGEDHDGQN
jgi:CheY-like chemotaxis protein